MGRGWLRSEVATALALGGVIAPILDVAVVAVLGAQQPGYSHVRQFISELGETGRPFAAIANLWFVVVSAIFVGFAVALWSETPPTRACRAAALLLGAWAATGIIGGFFPCDPGCRGETTAGAVHVILGIVGTLCLLPVPTLVWWGIRGNRQWQGIAWFTLVTQALVLASLLLVGDVQFGVTSQARSLDGSVGLLQRLSLGAIYMWTAVVGLKIARNTLRQGK